MAHLAHPDVSSALSGAHARRRHRPGHLPLLPRVPQLCLYQCSDVQVTSYQQACPVSASSTEAPSTSQTQTTAPRRPSPEPLQNSFGHPAQELTWPWKWGSRIRYFKAGNPSGQPVVLVHGFGVGAWHYENNLESLAESGYCVYAVDLLGQGSSWPSLDCIRASAEQDPSSVPSSVAEAATAAAAAATGTTTAIPAPSEACRREVNQHGPLRFSIAMWTDELASFIEQVVGGAAYVTGNSLGGYVAVSLAATRPELVKGLVLLNSTPFWSFRPPREQASGFWKLLEFDGEVPAPEGLKRVIERWWWNNLKSRETVESMLSLVYAHKPSVSGDPSVAERIIEATEHPAALDAFVSIVASPKSPQPFNALLCATRCPICLVYGRDDPWVTPAWGQRANDVLVRHGTPPAMYLELQNSGHCIHHESPRAANTAMNACFAYMDTLSHWREAGNFNAMPPPPFPVGTERPIQESDGRTVTLEAVDGHPRDLNEWFIKQFWVVYDLFQGQQGQAKAKGTEALS